MFWPFRPQTAVRKASMEDMAMAHPEFARLLASLGFDAQRTADTSRLIADLKSSIHAHIPDFVSFRQRLLFAARTPSDDHQQYAIADRELFEEVLRAGEDHQAVLAVLNRDPLGRSLPFIERIPVKRGAETIWVAPAEHAYLLKQPADPKRFAELLTELELLFRDPHPAIQDRARIQVLDAIQRLRRDLGREKASFPTAVQMLEARIEAFGSSALEPHARMSLQLLKQTIDDVESATIESVESDLIRERLREATERYLQYTNLRTRWMTNYLLHALLAPAQVESALRLPSKNRKKLELIRREVAPGRYNASEIARRLRTLEQDGLYFSSLVYVLLQHHENSAAGQLHRAQAAAGNSTGVHARGQS